MQYICKKRDKHYTKCATATKHTYFADPSYHPPDPYHESGCRKTGHGWSTMRALDHSSQFKSWSPRRLTKQKGARPRKESNKTKEDSNTAEPAKAAGGRERSHTLSAYIILTLPHF